MFYLGIAFSTFFILATSLSLVKSPKWYFRVFDFPKLQISLLGVLGLVFLIWSEGLSMEVLIICLLSTVAFIFQIWTIFPYTPFCKKEVFSTDPEFKNSLSVLICNVYMDNKNERLCKQVVEKANPDLMFFVETDDWWWNCLSDFQTEYPYVVKKVLSNTYGFILFSKFKLIDSQIHFLVKEDIPSINTKLELPGGDLIELWLLHPEPPVPGESNSSANRDAELLIVGKKVKDSKLPVIVGGDLNDVAWSHTTRLFKRISQLLDPRVGRGLFSTFPAKYPFLRWPLDHIFHSYHFKLQHLKTLGKTGSDHLPIFIKLALDQKDSKKPKNNTSDKSSDLIEMQEKVEKAKQDQ